MNARRFASIAGTVAVTVIAAVASYDHMRTVALDAGQSPLLAALLPLSVDGMILVATLALGDGRRSRWSAWLAFLVGVAASLAANVLAAEDDTVSRVVSAWPAVALLLTVEVLARAGRTPATVAPAADVTRQPVALASPGAVADTAPSALAGPPTPATARPQLVPDVDDSRRADPGRAADVTPVPAARVAVAAVSPPSRVVSSPVSSRPRQSAAEAVRAAAAEEGATPASVAAALGVSVRTCQRHWPRPAVAVA
ncbi:DUF2637 domain-containing protein [Micromonospora sp. WMMD718]|uniref:DUF2637 domain-containing protein n=1 Tax=Micromonospora sp. WMMD718 TaxID=3016098 RepID=UPI00241602FF|nr:DUF2637 domain-containing protein [Micromonospora sp. WMMD718]MDG4751706.1 DUF2637 domain-containing protein [Micromonospora sp. WMMD718]